MTIKGNLRKSWTIIKEVINKMKKSAMPNNLLIDTAIITDASIIADRFNEFYVNIGPILAKKIPLCNNLSRI